MPYSDYPVISVLQKPYEYYIIPTDNVIHDGSTLDCSKTTKKYADFMDRHYLSQKLYAVEKLHLIYH